VTALRRNRDESTQARLHRNRSSQDGKVVCQAPAALAGLVVGDKHVWARAGALGHLRNFSADHLKRAQNSWQVHAQRDLAGQHESLVGGQLVGELA
jgi:hypothetical protein